MAVIEISNMIHPEEEMFLDFFCIPLSCPQAALWTPPQKLQAK